MRLHFVIIDDDPDDVEILSSAIHEVDETIECITCSSCDVALTLFSSESISPPDYIFIDVHLPKIDGYECLKAIKALPQFNKVPIAMITTLPRSSDMEVFKTLGANFFFAKSHRVSEYYTMIRQVLAEISSVRAQDSAADLLDPS